MPACHCLKYPGQLFQHLTLFQGRVSGWLCISGNLKAFEPICIPAQVRREAMGKRIYRQKNVKKMRTILRNCLNDLWNGCPDLQALLPVEHPNSPVYLKIAGQNSQDVPKRSEWVTLTGLRIALTASDKHLRVGCMFKAREFPHKGGFSTSCFSQEEYRHAAAGQCLLEAGLEMG